MTACLALLEHFGKKRIITGYSSRLPLKERARRVAAIFLNGTRKQR